MKKKSEVYDGTQQGTFNSGGGDWGKQLGYHIVDFSSEFQTDDKKPKEKSKDEIIDKVLKEYTKRKEDERKNWEKLNPDGKGREVK